ncbi:hypothetical protein [Promicromonospora sp. NPDC023987]|uniref:hypothetical protein n=1 Tax=Promicromonospora sp. NPDC023987 TaxID=3155360 RepID=UPI00340B4B13
MTDTGPWTGSAWWGHLVRAVPLAGEVAAGEVAAGLEAGLEAELMTDGFVMELVSAELMARVRAGDPAAREAMRALGAELEAGPPVVGEDVISAYLIHVPSPGEQGGDLADTLGPRVRAALDQDRDHRNEPAVATFLDRLLQAVPALRPLADVERYGYHDEVLAHPFLCDVAERQVALLTGGASLEIDDDWTDDERSTVVRLFTSADPDPSAEVRAVLDFLEAELEADEAVDDLIASAFLEMLPEDDEPGTEIVGMLGTRLRAELDAQRRQPR